ncbi:MAG: hypothetical protein WC043_02560 [Pseudobdellovibrionaceae bacterium]
MQKPFLKIMKADLSFTKILILFSVVFLSACSSTNIQNSSISTSSSEVEALMNQAQPEPPAFSKDIVVTECRKALLPGEGNEESFLETPCNFFIEGMLEGYVQTVLDVYHALGSVDKKTFDDQLNFSKSVCPYILVNGDKSNHERNYELAQYLFQYYNPDSPRDASWYYKKISPVAMSRMVSDPMGCKKYSLDTFNDQHSFHFLLSGEGRVADSVAKNCQQDILLGDELFNGSPCSFFIRGYIHSITLGAYNVYASFSGERQIHVMEQIGKDQFMGCLISYEEKQMSQNLENVRELAVEFVRFRPMESGVQNGDINKSFSSLMRDLSGCKYISR